MPSTIEKHDGAERSTDHPDTQASSDKVFQNMSS
jgi:hypothetical protein